MKLEQRNAQGLKFAQKLVKAGLKVYISKGNFQWGYFTDGKGIGYFQTGSLIEGCGLTTCHIPNRSTGTGFRYSDYLDVSFAQNIVGGVIPNWVGNSDREISKPWGSWDSFVLNNKNLKLVEFDPNTVDIAE